MSLSTPRTDAATYPADCLGKTLVTHRDCARELERELTALTAERDQLRSEFEKLAITTAQAQERNVSHRLERDKAEAERCHLWKQRAEKAEAQLHALRLVCGTTDANKFETWTDRAERAEAAETVALARWNGALERAIKAEADLVALGQCHDDNCRAVVQIDAELATERAQGEKTRTALKDAISTYFGADKLVTAERIEAWQAAL